MPRTSSRPLVCIDYSKKVWYRLDTSSRFLMMRLCQSTYTDRRRIWLYFTERTYDTVLNILERRALPFSTTPSRN